MKFFVFKRALLINFILLVSVNSVNSQGTPVSQTANSMVNLNTGDFHYELPVMTVTGPNGEQVPITFGYQGGIRMDDQASWIGLGWNFNPGEITHNVRGVSDDWKNKSMTSTTKTATTRVVENTNYYGPLYYKDLNYSDTEASMDVASSGYKTTGLFNFPDYDKFHVSGVGISGTMEPRLFDANGKFYLKSKSGEYTYSNSDHFTKSPNFVFVDELVYTNSGPTGTGYNATTNRAHTASYIEVFTNLQIRTDYTALKAAGFLDYAVITGTRRPTTDFDDYGIGAFRITTPNGLVYHYSLPVYMKENEMSATFALNSSFVMDVAKELKESVRSGRYAESWKLTAITGLDYVDVNDNGIADNGDSGYWIAYNYGMWTDDFSWRTPYYNFKQNQYSKKVKQPRPSATKSIVEYKNEGTVSSGKVQQYYLNSIQTSTQTAFFIKEVRSDEHAVKDGDAANIKPSLRLSKIVLVRNENIPLFTNSASLPVESGFSLTGCSSSAIQPHIGNFNSNEMLIKQNSIAMADLIADYSLCKLVYNNIHNTFTLTSKSYPCNNGTDYTRVIYEASSGTSSTADNYSGKLTLNEVKIYGPKYKAAAPSTKFDYDQTVTAKNPNYDTDKTDYWGFYKSDFNSTGRWRYTTDGTSGSANNVDAWSLKKITTPLAGEIIVEYESDIYNYVSVRGNYVNPQRYYLIQSATYVPSSGSPSYWTVTVGLDANDFISSANLIRKEGYVPFNTPGAVCPSPLIAWGSNASSTFLVAGSYTSTTQNFDMYTTNVSPFSPTDFPSCNPTTSPVYDNSLFSGWGYVRLTLSSVPGGGTRVKQITIKDTESNKSYINEYSYQRGVVGSEPVDIMTKSTNSGLIEKNTESLDPLVPPAMVTYTNVTTKSKSLNNTYMGKTVHEFYNSYEPYSVFKSSDVIVTSGSPPHNPVSITANYITTETRGILNNPKSIIQYNNADQIVSSALYEYQATTEQAVGVSESFYNDVDIINPSFTFALKGRHARVNKVAQLKKVTTYTDGINSSEEFLAWDNVTGRPTKTRSSNSTAGVTEVWIDLAFRNSSYTSMGPKSIDAAYKNQLGEIAKVSLYRDKIVKNIYDELVPANTKVLVNGTKTTFRQSFPKRIFDNATGKFITQSTSYPGWLPYQTYIFNGSTNDATWKYDGETTIFNNRIKEVEVKDGFSRYKSSKLGYNHQYNLCAANDASYSDFTFSGFEDQESTSWGTYFGGEVSQGSMRFAGDATTLPHTGNYLAKVDAGAYGPLYSAKGFTKGRSYRASVWVHKNSTTNTALVFVLDGTSAGAPHSVYKSIVKSDASNITVGDWILMTLTMDVPADFTETGGTYGSNDLVAYVYNWGSTAAYFDDFMVRPIDTDLVGSVIDEKTGKIMAELDKNDFATKYIYDEASRIREIWTESPTEGWKLKKRYSYNYNRTY